MSNLYWLSEDQMERLRPYFPKSHGIPRVDDRRVLSDIIFINRNGLCGCDAPKEYGPHKALYNRWKRWNDMGVFARIMTGRAAEAPDNKTLSIDAMGRPIRFFMTAGQVSDYTGARALVSSLPAAGWLLGDRGYDADGFREELMNMGITPCIPGRKSRDKPVKYDKRRYRKRNRIEILISHRSRRKRHILVMRHEPSRDTRQQLQFDRMARKSCGAVWQRRLINFSTQVERTILWN